MAERAINLQVEDDPSMTLMSRYLVMAAEYDAAFQSSHSPERQLAHMEETVRWHRWVLVVRPEPASVTGYEISWIKGELKWDWPCEFWPDHLPSMRRMTAFLVPHRSDVDRMLMAYGDHDDIKAWRKACVPGRGRSWAAEMRTEVTASALAEKAKWRAHRDRLSGPRSDPFIYGKTCPVPLRKFARQR